MAMSIEYLEDISHPNEVNGFNLNKNSTILLVSCIDLTKHYSTKSSENVKFREEDDINNFKKNLETHLYHVNSFINILYQIKLFNDEFHKGCSIKNISEYLLNNNQLFLKHANFLLDLIDKFLMLCKYKSMNISKFSDSKIRKEYNRLSVDFRKFEMYFYTDIYQPSENYDEEFLENMSNLLTR